MDAPSGMRPIRRGAWLLISSGEVSGDVAGALLAREIARRAPSLGLRGYGGPRMAGAGVEILAHTNHLGVVGVSEAVRFVPALLRLFSQMRRQIMEAPPAAAVLLGNDVFHTVLARWLRRRGVQVASYFPPQIWLWRAFRGSIARSFDRILTSFPEEEQVYASGGGRTRFIGHYLADQLQPPGAAELAAARARLGLPAGAEALAVFPGSRRQELERLAPELMEAAASLCQRHGLQPLVAVAESGLRDRLEGMARDAGMRQPRLSTASHDVLRVSRFALLVSGTASLEASLLGTPALVTYRISLFTHAVIRCACRLGLMPGETMALPNLVLGHELVPELRQGRARAEEIAAVASSLLADEQALASMRVGYREVHRRLHQGGTLARAAREILDLASLSELAAAGAEIEDDRDLARQAS